MKTKNPSIKEMLTHYFISNQCTIQLKNNQILIGTFINKSPVKESNTIKGWHFKPNKDDPIIIPHDQILMIEKDF